MSSEGEDGRASQWAEPREAIQLQTTISVAEQENIISSIKDPLEVSWTLSSFSFFGSFTHQE